ncbi:MAG TPA: polysaccharide lyase family protein [Candidatus Binatia bacterium]|jgi:rhamnogalacturonan endolyase|nr:polysaccharide lyase family protein [Candidatus Binatia bacterium]
MKLSTFNFQHSAFLSLALWTAAALNPPGAPAHAQGGSEPAGQPPPAPPVTLTHDGNTFTLANGLVTARINLRTGTLVSLQYLDLELLAQNRGGANGGYWSSVGRSRPGSATGAVVRIDPAANGGARAEISCQLHNDTQSPTASIDADYRYALGRGEPWLYAYAVLKHLPGYPAFGVGEARYCLKLNPEVFDYMTVDADRHRVMPSSYDWDHGASLNLKEARRMTTGVHKGEAEHKYDYSAVLAETPAYGWSSTKHRIGLWLINPSQEYIGGGPTKAELTGHLDVNPGGLPTLLNMWVGSHYGGTTISVATNEAWTKVVGPFVLYCNSANSGSAGADLEQTQLALWKDALARAGAEIRRWPYTWLSDPDYPLASRRAVVSGGLELHDPFEPNLKMSNIWVGLSAPDYVPPPRFGLGPGRFSTNNVFTPSRTNRPPPAGSYGYGRGGFPPYVDWQRDAKFYQFWARADALGRFAIPNVRPGTYTLHAIADGVLGEFTLTNITVSPGEAKSLGTLTWTPLRFGRTLWEIGVPDRTAREFRHGDHYWQWGLYFDYPKEFPQDVNFIIGKSDWRRDWNYVQPPHLETRNVPVVGEEDEQAETSTPRRARFGGGDVRSTTWAITFSLPEAPRGSVTLRLAFCGTHAGCDVEALANGRSIGETGTLPSTSAMQRDGIRGYWLEKDLTFDASLLVPGTNVIKLLSHASSSSQGVMYDYLRLEFSEGRSGS